MGQEGKMMIPFPRKNPKYVIHLFAAKAIIKEVINRRNRRKLQEENYTLLHTYIRVAVSRVHTSPIPLVSHSCY